MKSQIHEHPKNNIKRVSKKLFFSAVALVAFSSVSMGNTIDIEEEKVIDCTQHAIDRVNKVEETQGCLTPTQYTHYFNSYYNDCMRNKVLGIQP